MHIITVTGEKAYCPGTSTDALSPTQTSFHPPKPILYDTIQSQHNYFVGVNLGGNIHSNAKHPQISE